MCLFGCNISHNNTGKAVKGINLNLKLSSGDCAVRIPKLTAQRCLWENNEL